MKSRPCGKFKSFGIYLMGSTALAVTGSMAPAFAQTAPATPAVQPEVAAPAETIQSITVIGTQRLEGDTVRSYIRLRTG